MYTILVQDDHTLIATVRERIMQRSKLINKMLFLVPQNYDDLDMTNTTVCMEYLKPVSHEYKSEILEKSSELYKGYLQYVVPFDTEFTQEAGDLELQLTFTKVEMDADGEVTQYVRKTSPIVVPVIPITAWSDVIPDAALSAIDQRIIKQDMQMAQMLDMSMAMAETIPDDLVVENGKMYLGKDGSKMENTNGVDVVLPRTPDNEDGSNDGFIDLDNYTSDTGDDEDGNFTEL